MDFKFLIRPVQTNDLSQLATIRAVEWGSHDYWLKRLTNYLNQQASPQKALATRTLFVAINEKDKIIGFVAGHATTRWDCEGELQWINVIPEYQGMGVSGQLLTKMMEWFSEQNITSICVNVEPDNEKAIQFYKKHGAEYLNEHWMVWKN